MMADFLTKQAELLEGENYTVAAEEMHRVANELTRLTAEVEAWRGGRLTRYATGAGLGVFMKNGAGFKMYNTVDAAVDALMEEG
jgi:hypothetical protein